MRARVSALGVMVVMMAGCGGGTAASSEPDASLTTWPPPDDAAIAELDVMLATLAATDPPTLDDIAPPTEGIWRIEVDGQLLAEGPMHEGRREGRWRRFAPSGQPIEEGDYHRDLPVGRWRRWNAETGDAMLPVDYDETACASPPTDIAPVMYCGTFLGNAAARGWTPPIDLEGHGVGELRRCIGYAEPWIAAGLDSTDHDWSSLVRRAWGPEVQGIVRRLAEEDLNAGGVWDERMHGAVWFLDGLPEEQHWITERALDDEESSPIPARRYAAHGALGARIASSPAFAARWYLALTHTASLADRNVNVLLYDAVASILRTAPQVTVALTARASDLFGEQPNWQAALSELRASYYLARGRVSEARAEIERAAIGYRLGAHALPLTTLDALRARL